MAEKKLLDGKRVLAVDDEHDVLDTLLDLLPMCKVVTASSFEEARGLLESQQFDLAILDIMGVNGYGLLDIATRKNIPAVMLTAHHRLFERRVDRPKRRPQPMAVLA
jgi:DNA-binding response OmpR family regulator